MTLKTWTAALAGGLCLWAGAAASARADGGPVVRTEHLEAQLAPQTVSAAPGSTFYVAVRQHVEHGWHTYWRNPGDSGEATTVAWTLPPGWKAGDIVWPAPEHVATGPLTNYVFSDEVLLPVPLEVPSSARPGDRVRLSAAVNWLVCKDVCIPGQAVLTLDTTVAAGAPALDPRFGEAVTRALAQAPKPAGLHAAFQVKGDVVTLAVTGDPLRAADVSHAWFYPYAGDALEASKPQTATRGPQGITFALPAGYAFQHGAPPKELAGVVSLGPGRAWEVSAAPGPLPPGASGLAGTGARLGSGLGSGAGGAGVLLASLGAAFLGGLVLNLMPCVFPVLSLKAAALARHTEAPEHARAEGLAYMGGVVGAFLLLAGVLIAVRAAGQEVGWGFQLQSPAVVAGLCLLMLLVALNLSGVFEVGGSVQGVGGGLASRGGVLGAVFTGALAVVVAAPCTAPFMAPAIGWALTQPPAAALSIFAALGLGLAAPLTLVSFIPALFRRLPRPGAWMEGLRHVLAFPMYATAAWLAWVFTAQAGVVAMPFLLAAGVVLAFAAWAWGVGQRQDAVLLPRIAAAAGLIAAAPLVAQGAAVGAASGAAPSPAAGAAAVGSLPQEPWSPARVAELTAQGRPVFVDFTAAWCITCQVNERGALAGRGVADAFKKTNAVYLKADWTRRDAVIARALAERGRSGVPLYLVYGPGEQGGRVLPQLLTEGLVVQAVEAAAKPA